MFIPIILSYGVILLKNSAIATPLKHSEEKDHVIHLYRNINSLVERVAHYVGKAITNNEGVVVISTAFHWKKFKEKLISNQVDVDKALSLKQLLCFDADKTLAAFMVNGRPDHSRFDHTVGNIIAEAKNGGFQPLRAYGEMVSLLWLQGNMSAAMLLEQFWNTLAESQAFSVLCAYEAPSAPRRSHRLRDLAAAV